MKRRAWSVVAAAVLAASPVAAARHSRKAHHSSSKSEAKIRRMPDAATLRANPEAEIIGDGRGGEGSHRPRLSRDGRYVVFESTVRLVPEDDDRRRDVYLYDRNTRTYRRMHRPAGAYAAGGAAISDDGQYVAYHSFDIAARQGVEPITSIILVNVQTGVAQHIPPPWKGPSSRGEALFPALSGRGAQMAFTSTGPGLAGRVLTNIRQVYVYDRVGEDVRLVSRAPDGATANRASAEPRISADGRKIAFLSSATNLATELPKDSLAYHLYFVDRSTGTFIRVDEIERGVDPKDWIVDGLDMDAAGRTIVFQARARKVGGPLETLATSDLFAYDTSTGTARRLTSGIFAGRSSSPAISGNGRWIAFLLTPVPSKHESGGVVVYDRERALWRMVVNGRCANPTVSGDGKWIAYESSDPGVTHDRKNIVRIFVQPNPSYEDANGGG